MTSEGRPCSTHCSVNSGTVSKDCGGVGIMTPVMESEQKSSTSTDRDCTSFLDQSFQVGIHLLPEQGMIRVETEQFMSVQDPPR